MSFEFDYSTPHPAEMGEIYDDQLYHVMSGMLAIRNQTPTWRRTWQEVEIRYGDNDGRPLVDISNLPPLDLSRDRIRLPEVCMNYCRLSSGYLYILTINSGELEEENYATDYSVDRKGAESRGFGCGVWRKLSAQFSKEVFLFFIFW